MVNYNPFYPLTEDLVEEILRTEHRYMVIQQFLWPSLDPARTFMALPYKEKQLAEDHVSRLQKHEGKLFDLTSEAHKIINTIKSNQYNFFINNAEHQDWEAKMISVYKVNMILNIKAKTTLKESDKLEIHLNFEYGRLMARILIGNKELTLSAYDLIK